MSFVMAALSFSVASVVENVLQQHGRLKDLDLESRKAEEAGKFSMLFWVFGKNQFWIVGWMQFSL